MESGSAFQMKTALPLARSKATNGAIQIWNSSNVEVYNSHVDASHGLGLIAGESSNVKFYGAEVQNTTADGCSFINVGNGYLDGLTATNTGDDGLSVINYSYYTNNTGFTGTNIQSVGSKARGISVPGQSNVSISNFTVSNSSYDGVLVLTDGAFSTARPSNVAISNGTVQSAGTNGVEISGADSVTLTSIQVNTFAESGFLTSTSNNNHVVGSNLSATKSSGGALFPLDPPDGQLFLQSNIFRHGVFRTIHDPR